MPQIEYVKMSWDEISILLNGQYTLAEVAQAFGITRERLRKDGRKIPTYVIEDPQEFVRMIESTRPRYDNRLRP